MNMKCFFLSLLLAFLFVGCGDSSSGNSSEGSSEISEVETFDKLLSCTWIRRGNLVRVVEKDTVYECTDEGWVVADSVTIQEALAKSSSSEDSELEESESSSSEKKKSSSSKKSSKSSSSKKDSESSSSKKDSESSSSKKSLESSNSKKDSKSSSSKKENDDSDSDEGEDVSSSSQVEDNGDDSNDAEKTCTDKNNGEFKKSDNGEYFQCVKNEWIKVTAKDAEVGIVCDNKNKFAMKDTVVCDSTSNGFEWRVMDKGERSTKKICQESTKDLIVGGYVCEKSDDNTFAWRIASDAERYLKKLCVESLFNTYDSASVSGTMTGFICKPSGWEKVSYNEAYIGKMCGNSNRDVVEKVGKEQPDHYIVFESFVCNDTGWTKLNVADSLTRIFGGCSSRRLFEVKERYSVAKYVCDSLMDTNPTSYLWRLENPIEKEFGLCTSATKGNKHKYDDVEYECKLDATGHYTYMGTFTDSRDGLKYTAQTAGPFIVLDELRHVPENQTNNARYYYKRPQGDHDYPNSGYLYADWECPSGWKALSSYLDFSYRFLWKFVPDGVFYYYLAAKYRTYSDYSEGPLSYEIWTNTLTSNSTGIVIHFHKGNKKIGKDEEKPSFPTMLPVRCTKTDSDLDR